MSALRADCSPLEYLTEGTLTPSLLADEGYDRGSAQAQPQNEGGHMLSTLVNFVWHLLTILPVPIA